MVSSLFNSQNFSHMKSINSSMEKVTGGIKLDPIFLARAFLKKWGGLFPGKTTRDDEKSRSFPSGGRSLSWAIRQEMTSSISSPSGRTTATFMVLFAPRSDRQKQ